MGARCRSPRPPGSELGKWGYPSGKQSTGLMPNYSLTNTPSGTLGGLTTHHPVQYVPTCHWGGTERSREVHPLRPPAKPTQARSQRKLVCRMAGGLSDLPERNLGPISWGISAKEVTQPAAIWALAERGCYSRHLVPTDELVAEIGGTALQEEDQCGVTAAAYQPFSQPEAYSRSCERESWHDEALQEAREAQQWVVEATHRLELDIKRLSQGAGNVQCQHPHSHSGSNWQSKSFDRWERSPSQHRPERHVTFWEPEVEPYSGEGPYQEPWGHLPWAQMRRGEEDLLPTGRTEVPCPWEMPVAYPDIKNRMGDLWEPSIKNYEVLLNWWAHQLDTLHWWGELAAIPGVEDPRRLT